MSAPRRRSSRLFTTSAFGALALAAFWAAPAQAQLVQTGATSNGTAPTVDQSVPNTTTVTLGGSRTVIDWSQFDINSGDTANFVFANRSDIVLNRVNSAATSTINGNLNGTIGSAGGTTGGNIWIYNANGVVIGANARISTGGLLVTTAALDRATDSSAGGFLDGSSTSFGFTGAADGTKIDIQSGAQITSHGGAIALVAPVVTAEAGSSISAQDGGNVLVGSASKYQISFRQTAADDMDLLSFEVASAADGAGTSGTDAISLGGDISGNRVFVAAISKQGLVASVMNTGTITATTAMTDETGAIVLGANHNIVNGAAAAAPVSGTGMGYVTTLGGSVAGPKVDFVASENVLLRGDVGEAGAIVNLRSDNTDVKQFQGVITADTLTASAHTGINFNSFSANKVDKLGALSTDAGDIAYIGDEDGVEITGAISAPGKVTLGARGFMDTTTGSITAGSLELSLGGGGSFKVNGDANLSYGLSNGAVTIQATGGITLSNEFGMLLGDTLTLTADAGAIRETGGFISGGGAVVANAAGEIDLSGANSFTSLTAISTDGENITVNATGNLDFKVNTFSSARFTVGGDATSSGTNALIAGGLHVSAGGAINLSSDGGDAAFGDLQANGNITVAMDGVLRLGGVIQANGGTASFTSRNGAIQQLTGSITADAISFDADSTITQSNGAFVQTGALSLTSGGTATLGSANSFTSLQDLHVGGDLTLRNAGSINLDPTNSGGYTSDGALTLTSDTGNIIAGNIVTTSKLTASAVNGNIQLGGGGHQIGSLGTMTAGGSIEIGTSRTGFSLTGDITATNLTLLAQNGGITQNAGTTISASTLNATANGNITLDQANAVTTVGGLNANLFTTGHSITFRNADTITLGGVVDATDGTLRLTSNTGGISQNGGASIYIRADQLFLSGASDLLLNNTSNNIATLGGATSTNGGILYRDANGFDIAGNITATSGGASLRTAGAGSITQSGGIIDVDYLGAITVGGGSVTLNQANRIHRLIATSGNGTLSINSTTDLLIDQSVYFGTISLSSGGAITQSNTGSLGAGTLNLSAVTGINLPGASLVGNNGILDFGTITNTTSGGINIVSYSGSHITLSGNISAAGQTVSITDIAGSINQSAGVITADTLNLSATGGISAGGNNQVTNLGAVTAGAGSVGFGNAGDFNITQSINVTGAGLDLYSDTGAITQNAGTTLTADRISFYAGTTINQGTGATLHTSELSLASGGNVTLGEANDFTTLTDLAVGGDLTLRNLGNINLSPILGGTGGYRSGGALTLVSDTGNILTTNSGIATSRLTVSAAGSISLDGTIASLGTITAGQSILLSTYNGSMELTGNITGQNVSLYGDTGLSQSGGIIDAGRLNVITDGNISLTGANQIDVVGRLDTDRYDFGTGHDITLRNVGAIVLDYQIEAPGGTVTLISDTGGISQTSFSDRFIAGTLKADAAGDIVLDYAGNAISHLGAIRSQGGGVTIVDANAFDLTGQVRAAGALSLTSGGAITTNGGLVVAGGLLNISATSANLVAGGNIQLGTVTTNGNFAIDTDGDLTVAGLLNTNGGDATLTAAFGTIGHGASGTISANKVTASARDGITLDSTGNALIWASSSNGGDINLTGDADIFFKIDTAGDLTVDAGGMAGNNDSVIARSVGINAVGGISLFDQTVTIDIGSYRYLTSSAGAIDVENQGDINLDGNVTASGGTNSNYVRLNSTLGSVLQNSGTISGYSVELDAAQSVTQNINAKVVTGDYGLTLRATDVSLIGANEFPWISSYTVTHDLTLRVVGTIDMSGSANQAGSNHYTTLISDTGNIIGGPINADRLSATATNGRLSFTYGNNHIGSLGDLTAKNTGGTDIDIFSDSLLGLTGNITGGGVNIYATQGINQTGGAITADRLYTGTSGDLLLGGANNFGQLLDFGHGNGKNVTIRNLGSITLPGTLNSFGTLTLTSDTGSISQTSAITVATLIASAASGITLNTSGNNFTTLGVLTTAAGDIRIADTGGFAIEGNITAPGTVALASTGNVTTGTTTVGSVTTAHGKVDADTLIVSAVNATVYAAGDIKLGASAVSSGFTLIADGGIDLTATSSLNLASLVATAGSITQSGGILTGNSVLTAAYGSITLDKANTLSDFGGTSYNGGTITFNNASSSAMTLSLHTAGDAVITAAGNLQGFGIVVDDLSVTAGHIDLTNTIDVNSFSKLVASYGDVLVTNTGSFSITGDVTASTAGIRSVNLQATGGGITQTAGTISANDVTLRGSGDLAQSGTGRVVTNVISLTGSNVLFGGANDFGSGHVSAGGSLTLRNAGSIDLDALGGYSNGGGALTLTSDNGSITAHNAVVTAALSALAANGNVTFDNANSAILRIDGLRALGTGTVYTNSPLFLNGNLEAGTLLTLRSQGGIIRLGGAIKAASLSVTNGGSGSIALNGDNDVDTLVALTAAGDVSFRDIDGFQIDGNVSGDHVTLTADAGSIYEKSGSTLTANHLTASAVDGLQLNQIGNSIVYIDGLTLSGPSGASLGIASGGGDMHLAGDVNAAGQYVTFYVAGGSLIQDSGTITAGNLGITVPDGSATLGANAISNLGSINIRDDFTANSDLSTGVLGLNGNIVVGETTSITNFAGISQGPGGSINTYNLNLNTAGTLDMGNVINMVGGQANIAMGSGSFLSYLDLNLRLNATGAAMITSYGNINFTGAGSSSARTLNLSAATGIYSAAGVGGQIAVNHLGDVANSGSGGIALNLLGNVTLEGDLTAAGQTVSIGVDQGLSQAADTVITADRLNVTVGSVIGSVFLDNANAISTFGLYVPGDVTVRSTLDTTIASGLAVGHSLIVHSDGDITMGGGWVTGTLGLYSGGAVSSTGNVSAYRLTGSAAGDFYLGLNSLNNLDTIESGGDVSIGATYSHVIIVGDITAAGGIEISGDALSQTEGTITTGVGRGIGLSASGVIDQSGGRIIAGTISAVTGGYISLLGANQVGATGNYLSAGGTNIDFRNQGDIVANSDFRFQNGGGLLTLISDTGSITQSTALGVGYVRLQAATGIDFSNSGNTIGAIAEATNSTSGGIVLVNSGDLRVDGGITATGQAVSLTSVNGAVSQAAAGVIGANSLDVSAQTGVQLNANNNIREITGLSNAVSGGISFNNFLAYELNGNVTAAGQQVTLDSTAGGVVQIGGIITADNVTSSSYGGIRLDMVNNVGASTASSFSSTVGNISFRSANAILLGTVNTTGLLSLTADTGDITQTGAISADRLTASAVGGDIVLDQLNAIGTLNNITALDGFSLRTSTGLTLDGEITAHDLVKLVAGGDITQVGTGAIHSDFLEATSGVGAANGISLLNHNQVGNATLNSNGKDLRFRNTGDFALGNISAAGHIVEMISDTGSVTQLAGTSILAGTFSATGTNVVLDNSGNQISRIGLISTSSDLSLRNDVALQIDAIDAGSHNVTISNGDNLTGGNITAGKLTLNLTGGYVDLTTASHVASLGGFNGYQLAFTNAGSFTISGAIQNAMYQTFLTSQNGSISMAGGAVNSGAVTLQAATGISITGNLSYVYGATTATGDVSILSTLLDIQGDISGDTVTLGGNANGGFVRQTSGSVTANLLNGSSYGSFELNGATNHIAALGTLSSGDDVNIHSLDAVALTGNIDAGDVFALTAGGAVSQAGGRIQSFSLDVTAAAGAGSISLDRTNQVSDSGTVALAGSDITFRNDGSFRLGNVNADGVLALTSVTGSIGQESGTAITADTLTASAGTSIGLGQINNVGALGKLSAGTGYVSFVGNDYDLTDDITSGAGGFVSLGSMGAINQTGGKITTDWLAIDANRAYLDRVNQVRQLGTVSTAGDFIFRNVGDIEIWGTINAGYLGLRSNTGGVSNPGALFHAGTLDITAPGSINLNGGSLNYIDSLTSQDGDITLITSSNILGANLISASGTVDLDVGRITADSVKANLLRVSTTGDVEMTGDNVIAHLGNIYGDNVSLGVGVTSITGSVTGINSVAFVRSGLASDFALTMAGGAITAPMISLSNTGSAGTATLSNIHATGALELNFNFNGNADITAPISAISLNNATVDGDLSLHASSGITTTGAATAISGTLSAQTNTGNIDLLLNGTVGHFGDITANSGAIRLGAASVDLTGAITPSVQTLELVASNGSVTQGANSVITVDRITGSATNGDFLLTGANHISTLGAITVTGGDFAVATDRSLTIDADVTTDRANSISLISTLAGGPAIQNSATGVLHTGTLNIQAIGDVVLTNQDILRLGLIDPTLFSFSQAADYDITGDIVADAVELTSTAGKITQSGGAITAGSTTLSAQNGIELLGNNHFGSLSLTTLSGDIGINNVGDLVLTSLTSPGNASVTVIGGGSLTIGSPTVTAAGNLSLEADSFVAITGVIDADGDVSVTSHNSVVNLFTVQAGDDISVSAATAVSIAAASIGSSGNDSEADGHNMVLRGDSVTLGASSAAGLAVNNVLSFNGATGNATINAGAGGAAVNLYSMDQAVSILATGAVQAQVNTGDLLLGNVSGSNVSLRSLLGSVNATGMSVNGDYTLWSGTGFNAGALSPCGCGIANLTITQDNGNLFLPTSIGATGNILITVSAGALDADTGVQLGALGDVEIHAANIGIGGLSGNNVTLIASAGTIDVRDFLLVANNYTLTGHSFAGAALAPGGARAGTWALTSTAALDMGGNTLEYDGDIDFSVSGLLSNGTIHSLSGAVTGSASAADLYELLAGTNLDVTASSGSLTAFHVAADSGSVTLRSNQAVTVTGSIEAGTDVSLSAQFGAASAGYASAGRAISVYSLFGNATLRQVTLTGTTGDVTVQSILGMATLGADDSASIDTDNYFERAAGSTSSAYVIGSSGARVNLDHSADLALVKANSASVNVTNGDLTIGMLYAFNSTASAYLGNGSLRVNSGSGSTVDLAAWGGDLTLGGGGISANDLYLNSDGTIDTSAIASLSTYSYLYIEGGSVRAAGLSSDGNVEVYADTGGVTADTVGSGGDLWVGTTGDLKIDHVSAVGYADLETSGAATIRDLTASNGFGLLAQGNITLGADAGAAATSANTVVTNGTLGAGCGCTGGWLVSAGGDISVNLFSVTGVLDRVTADAGDVSISVASGDLGINLLRGHNIAVSALGQLSIVDAQSSGGSYSLTAADFGGFTLSPSLFGGATSLGDVTIIDTDGNLNSFGSLHSSGDIHVEARDGAVTGGLALTAAGDITAIGQGVALQWAEGRDVTIDAGTGTAAISNTLSVGRDYTVTAGDFSGNALVINGAKAGSLSITDTAGDFDFGATDFAFGGAITIDASHGLLNIGNLQAGSAIDLNAGGNLSLASAKLTGTGTNTLSLTAGGDLQFGAANAASIASSNVFSHASPTLTGTSIHADGNLAINLYQADGLGAIEGGTVQIAVAAGDFSTGDIDAVGALFVQGPAGTLTLGDLTTSGGNIGISGQGNTSLGDVSGHLVIDLGASAGNLSVGTVSGGDVSFLVSGGITADSISASTLGVVAVNGSANLDASGAGSHVASLSTVTVGGDFALNNLRDLSLDGAIEVGDLLDLQVAGALTQNAWYIVADRLQGNVTGAATLTGDNRINALGAFSSNGLKLSNATALTIDGAVQANGGAAVIASHGGMTISANGSVTSAAAGDAITLASDGLFTNLAGAGALSTPNGRWLVYTQTGGNPGQSNPNNNFGGLAGISYYGDAYNFGTGSFASAPNAGNRFVYGYSPVLTVTPSSLHLVYDGTVPNVTTTITGLVNGDSAAGAWSGSAAISGVGSNAGTYFAYSSLGTLSSEMGYTFAFVPGTVIIDPRVITAVLNANDRTYDGTTNASGTLTLTGLIGNDAVTANAGSMSFDNGNAGTGRTVTAGGITLSGAAAGNYTVNAIATDLADILARAITATLTANDRTYDGTTGATGTLTLNGVLGNDAASVAGATLAFDNGNAGTGRTVTASGITLSGAQAGNYTVTTTATDLADILARAITATLTANDRTYDGTTNATGTLSLAGVLGNDQVTANGSLAFNNGNAGTGRTVTASGITLSGAQAGNYTVNLSATDLADIFARAITATLTANDRTYDGTNAATGTLALSGVISGDTVSAGAASMVFDNLNAGTGRTVTATGIMLTGAQAGNYTVNISATDLADILARAITATLSANGRVYDGTTAATGSLSLNGVLSGDQVTVSAGGIAFDSRNAGTRTATASGLTLGGSSAGNYTISGTATGTAVISQRAISATATANNRTYDSTTAATGSIALSGVISGDTVTGTASYAFTNANAGNGRTVLVSGLGLSGTDASNYTVSLASTPVTANITPRSVSVTISDVTKLLGQPDPVFGYTVTSGSLVNGDAFTGTPIRAAGDMAGTYVIGQGTLALSANYLLTVVPGTLVISFTQSGADGSDALKMLRARLGIGFSVNQDPSRNLEGDGGQGAGDDGAK